MKRFIALLAVLSVLVVSFVACGQKEPAETTGDPAITEAAAETSVFTGTLEDKKDFMITVVGEDGSAYAFNLNGTPCPAEVSQTVAVTYTGDISDIDAQLTVVSVDVVQ